MRKFETEFITDITVESFFNLAKTLPDDVLRKIDQRVNQDLHDRINALELSRAEERSAFVVGRHFGDDRPNYGIITEIGP